MTTSAKLSETTKKAAVRLLLTVCDGMLGSHHEATEALDHALQSPDFQTFEAACSVAQEKLRNLSYETVVLLAEHCSRRLPIEQAPTLAMIKSMIWSGQAR